jgi:UDP-3-O-[3-hydroxymyristoyl] N-acetylglucosamine deacetylase
LYQFIEYYNVSFVNGRMERGPTMDHAEMQQTIAEPIIFTGVALHTGHDVHIRCLPAPEDTGIRFQRTDLAQRPYIRAAACHIVSTNRCTTLGSVEGQWQVHTIEHLLAAISMAGVDNLLVEIDAEEPPVADGSAAVFLHLLVEAGVVPQDHPRRILRITEPVFVRDREASLIALPYDGLRISYTLSYEHPVIGTQYIDLEITQDTFRTQIASARTFGFAAEVAALHARGLGLGGSLENAVLIGNGETVNPLRFPDEFVRHKVLDLIGDLAVNGRVMGHFIGIKSGHKLNAELSRKLSQEQEETITC